MIAVRTETVFHVYILRLEKMGALDVSKVVHRHQGWRLITCIWLHAGVLHLLANMLSLLVIGIRLEQEFGFVRIGLLYLISGFGGSLLSALFIQSSISVGASGALFGLLGGMLSELITNWTMYVNKVAALLTLVVIIVIQSGCGDPPTCGQLRSHWWLSLWFSSWLFVLDQASVWMEEVIPILNRFTFGLVLLLHGYDANDHCSWCHYLSCVPTSRWKCGAKSIFCLVSGSDN
ncbi:unnamed protein product [Thlaspi arvense]|uniref:RHOMBOID-like protein n=1 Tax=Thlaspi arvense TaxID=13288 RepID=A0AAU9RKJ0_THLAR|nr:unnamed protein product [Thlaspi arvense]